MRGSSTLASKGSELAADSGGTMVAACKLFHIEQEDEE